MAGNRARADIKKHSSHIVGSTNIISLHFIYILPARFLEYNAHSMPLYFEAPSISLSFSAHFRGT